MTNRQIAARLYLSPRTIQTHVSHIMRKLDHPAYLRSPEHPPAASADRPSPPLAEIPAIWSDVMTTPAI